MHQKQFAAKRRHQSEHLPTKTKEDLAPYFRQYAMEKQKRVKLATPPWADRTEIKLIYEEAARLTRETGIKYEVDHIIPLTNPAVSGLHVESNLRIITKDENRLKRNYFSI